ncbi:MAG: CbiX/SirB N-terminal domain-containing protein [Haloarcula sp.]
MPHDTLLLIGRDTSRAAPYETHAHRLRERGVATDVTVLTYDHEPQRELRDDLVAVDADRVFALPLTVAHDHTTVTDVPAALDNIDAETHYCEPVGRSPLLTEALRDRAASAVPENAETSVALVAFGSSGKPYQRQVTEYHAERLRERSAFGEVEPCYLLQNPAVECVRYNLTRNRAVAVPLFLAPSDATAEQIPTKLDLDRGGLSYTEPLDDHALVTEAIATAVETARTMADANAPQTFEAALAATSQPMATDGEGD